MQRTLQELKQEADQLEQEYQNLLQAKKRMKQADTNATEAGLRQKYSDETVARNALRQENDHLRNTILQHTRFHTALRKEASTFGVPLVRRVARFVMKRPLDAPEAARFAESCSRAILTYRDTLLPRTSEPQVFGYHNRRSCVTQSLLLTTLYKRFAGVSALELALRSWQLFQQPDKFIQVYSPALETTLSVLQRIGDDHLVFHRQIKRTSGDGKSDVFVFSVMLASLVRLPNGWMVAVRSLDQDRVAREQPDPIADDRATWWQMFSWCVCAVLVVWRWGGLWVHLTQEV